MREFYNHYRQLPDQHWPPTHLQFNEILSRTCDILGTDFYIDDQSVSVVLIYGMRLVVF